MISCKLVTKILCIALFNGGADGTRTSNTGEHGYAGHVETRPAGLVNTHVYPPFAPIVLDIVLLHQQISRA